MVSKPDTTALTLTWLRPVWPDKYHSSKIQMMFFIVTSIFLYAYESLTPHTSTPKKNTNQGNEVRWKYITHLIQRPCYKWGIPCQDPESKRTTQRSPDNHKEMYTAGVWLYFQFINLVQKPYFKAQWKGEEDKMDKGRAENEQCSSSAMSRRQRRPGRNGENRLQIQPLCPNDPQC